jgi:hypothetical protein
LRYRQQCATCRQDHAARWWRPRPRCRRLCRRLRGSRPLLCPWRTPSRPRRTTRAAGWCAVPSPLPPGRWPHARIDRSRRDHSLGRMRSVVGWQSTTASSGPTRPGWTMWARCSKQWLSITAWWPETSGPSGMATRPGIGGGASTPPGCQAAGLGYCSPSTKYHPRSYWPDCDATDQPARPSTDQRRPSSRRVRAGPRR